MGQKDRGFPGPFDDAAINILFFLVVSGVIWWGTDPIRVYLNGFKLHPLWQIGIAVGLIILLQKCATKLGIKKRR